MFCVGVRCSQLAREVLCEAEYLCSNPGLQNKLTLKSQSVKDEEYPRLKDQGEVCDKVPTTQTVKFSDPSLNTSKWLMMKK
ncbi:hypothetical protein CEXT_55831 [Caerostris extrusa]|uniref:Uncharacterized protein n=1 Tax=Caerostris extrusa TaxID=172846 RepID=A0AAV4VHP4_CAEEX|nr:hypothetical protein CEXT_55831 [Caerostris extrusa]